MRLRPTVLAALMLVGVPADAQNVRVGVLGLFHPHQFAVSPVPGSALIVHAGATSIVFEPSSGVAVAHIRARGDSIVVDVKDKDRILRASEVTVTSRENGAADFNLSIPEKIARHYRGVLELKAHSGVLTAVVTMDLETAVASVVAAESTSDVPSEALKALAVAARSYFIAGKGRHHDFDFCDTTHCQFLRAPPPPTSAPAQAASATRGLVIAYQSQPVAAMYTRSCAGRTHTPAELGLPTAAYPYFPADCLYCRQHPARWQSRLSAAEAANLRSSNESSRLLLGRRLGWNAVQSDDFVMRKEGGQIVLRGIGQGHGIGLCQAGAKAMAEAGADFRQILTHYYPNTLIIALDSATPLR